jgi:F-type H+-transporting ATPase subunit delta
VSATRPQIDSVARVYARSLFELAEESGGREKSAEVAEELEAVCELARANRQFAEFLASPIVDVGRRSEALGRIFGDRVTDLVLRFLLVLNAKGRLDRLEAINTAFDQLVQEAYGRIEVDVFTAAPLGRDQLDLMTRRVRDALRREPVLHLYTDPSMIGGVKLRVGDRLIDGSIASRLRRIRQQLKASGPAALRARAERLFDEGGKR